MSKCLHQFLQLTILLIQRPGSSLEVCCCLLELKTVSTPTGL